MRNITWCPGYVRCWNIALLKEKNGQPSLEIYLSRYMFISSNFEDWVVVSNIFNFYPYLGKIPILTNIFGMGWNHQQ